MQARIVVFADGETNISVDTIAPDTVAPPAVTSAEIVVTTVQTTSQVADSGSSNGDVVAVGLIGGAVLLALSSWAYLAKGRS